MKNLVTHILLALPLALIPLRLSAQGNEACLACHQEEGLTMDKKGKTISLVVTGKEHTSSVHADMECVACHQDFKADDIPHADPIKPVDCAQCHDVGNYWKSIHGQAAKGKSRNAPQCASCHGKHAIQPAKKLAGNVNTCITCHNTADIKGYTHSKHFLVKSAKAPSCGTCHGSGHNVMAVSNPASPANAGKSTQLCSNCHPTSSPAFMNSVHSVVFRAGNQSAPSCVSCHGAHALTAAGKAEESKTCLTCHLDPAKLGNAKNTKELVAFARQYTTSVHGRAAAKGKEAATCVDCHGNHVANKALDPRGLTSRKNQANTCGKCHAQQSQDFLASNHGTALTKGDPNAPICTDCHGEHDIHSVKDATNKLSRRNQPRTCLKCHADNPAVAKTSGITAQFMRSYLSSVHAQELFSGNLKAAVCSDCHGAHRMMRGGEALSAVNITHVDSTCGNAACHPKAAKDYRESIHGAHLAKGGTGSPTCTYCHGQHNIMRTSDPDAPVNGNNLAQKVCVPCHSSVEMSRKYGIVENPSISYLDSYHGLAMKGGSKIAANCASCHGTHSIKPSSDPASSIHPANLKNTCGKCHPNSSENFVVGGIHVVRTDETSGINYTITTIYIILIFVTIGGMAAHNAIDFIVKSRHKLKTRRSGAVHHGDHGLYVRMSLSERLQHAFLVISFTLLVLTGFGLTYPDAWWVQIIRQVGGEWAFQLRGLVHRIAAVVMIVVSLYHAYYLFFVPRGRRLLIDILPRIQDVKDVIAALKYYFGRTQERPKFDRFSYIEKAEYWALIWGTFVMVGTGFMLWFHEFFGALTSKTALDVAETIHFYEAWLATLAIIVWHFYFVIFNPDVYPMNVAWFKGTLTEYEMEEEHPLELERMKAGAAGLNIDTSNGDFPIDDTDSDSSDETGKKTV